MAAITRNYTMAAMALPFKIETCNEIIKGSLMPKEKQSFANQ